METLPLQGTPGIPRFTKDKVSEEKRHLLGSFGAALEHSFVLTTLGRGPPSISATCQGSSKTTVVSVGLWLLLLPLRVVENKGVCGRGGVGRDGAWCKGNVQETWGVCKTPGS